MITAASRIAGLIAHPVGHSLSPLLQNTLAERTGLDFVYLPLEVRDPARLGEALRGAAAFGFAGMNVTVPYKEAVIPYLSGIDPWARKIGAVNTLTLTESGYEGSNTDLPGMKRFLDDAGISLRERAVVVLGAGGAAKAIAVLAGSMGAGSISLLNRTVERAEALKEELFRVCPGIPVTAAPVDSWKRAVPERSIVFQCTSVGMFPGTEEVLIEDDLFYRRAETGIDIVYTPSETVFLKKIRKAGGKGYSGLPMLVNQGILSFERWNGLTVPDEVRAEVCGVLRAELDRREGRSAAQRET